MSRKRKPRAILNKEFNGLWGFGPIMEWVARDAQNNIVAHERTRRDCEHSCVLLGYIPDRTIKCK